MKYRVKTLDSENLRKRWIGNRTNLTALAGLSLLLAMTLGFAGSCKKTSDSESELSSSAAGSGGTRTGCSQAARLLLGNGFSGSKWVKDQWAKSLTLLLSRIDESGGVAAGDKALRLIEKNFTNNGAITAAGGVNNSEYPFNWVRDAAITMREWVTKLASVATGKLSPADRVKLADTLEKMKKYAEFTNTNQHTPTVKVNTDGTLRYDSSGKLEKEINFGEPKFFLKGESYDGLWGRPQNDGPALRSLAIGKLKKFIDANLTDPTVIAVFGNNPAAYSKSLYDPSGFGSIIKADLEYISHHWQDPSFDLWEELKGDHFYTRMVQMKSLFEGAKVAKDAGDPGAAAFYEQQAKRIEIELNSHWDAESGIVRATMNNKSEWMNYKKSGLDSAVILAVLHSDGAETAYTASNDRILSTANHLEESFRKEYDINKGSGGKAVAIGRYPEDRYCGRPNCTGGGNPWVLLTNTFGEYYYQVAHEFERSSKIIISRDNLAFFKSLLPDQSLLEGQEFVKESSMFGKIQVALVSKGDEYLALVQSYSKGGRQHEQIDRISGKMVGAEDLTWNAGSFLSALRRRIGF
jgi:glucoamylase